MGILNITGERSDEGEPREAKKYRHEEESCNPETDIHHEIEYRKKINTRKISVKERGI